MKKKLFYFNKKILIDEWSHTNLMSLKRDKQPLGLIIRKLLLEHNYNRNRKFSITLWKDKEQHGTKEETTE